MSWLELYRYSTFDNAVPHDKDYLISLLDDYEYSRFERYKFDSSRWTFAIARWIAKSRLSDHLEVEPAAISFSYNENGKPYMAYAAISMYFSITHTDTAIVVVLSDVEVGVDIEMLDRPGDPWNNCEAFLNGDVASVVDSVTSDFEKKRCFARYWTTMEARVKVHGSTLFSIKETFAKDMPALLSDGRYSDGGYVYYTSCMNDREQLSVCASEPFKDVRFYKYEAQQFRRDDTMRGIMSFEAR